MPAVPAGGKNAKNGAGDAPKKKKKEPPKEFCGCGVDTYRPPPKGKKATAPVEHSAGCNYQRTTCDAYPYLPFCEVCQHPCAFCGGKNRWCPHCYESQCHYRFKRVVFAWAPPSVDAGPGNSATIAGSAAAGRGNNNNNAMAGSAHRSTVKFTEGGSAAALPSSGSGRAKKGNVNFVPTATSS